VFMLWTSCKEYVITKDLVMFLWMYYVSFIWICVARLINLVLLFYLYSGNYLFISEVGVILLSKFVISSHPYRWMLQWYLIEFSVLPHQTEKVYRVWSFCFWVIACHKCVWYMITMCHLLQVITFVTWTTDISVPVNSVFFFLNIPLFLLHSFLHPSFIVLTVCR